MNQDKDEKTKVLLVDDELGIRKVLGISLSDRGYHILTAESGEEALKIFKREHPDIVVTDIKMPGMDGIDVLKRIKQENPETEVIVITGHGDMDLAIKSLKYEATDFITKPIDDDELDKALEKCIKNINSRETLKQYTKNLEQLVQQKTQRLESVGQTQEELETIRKYQQFFDEIPGYVAVIDKTYRISSANRQFKQDFNYAENQTNFCYNILKRRNAPCSECPVATTFEKGASYQSEMKYKSKKGDDCEVLMWTTPIREASGDIARVMIMATDIGQVMNLQDHLASLGLMMGSVSHGIKGLLTGLDGGLYMLNSGFTKEQPEKIEEGLEIVKLMVGRIKSMVLDILYYAKEREPNLTDTNVIAFARDIARVVRGKTEKQKIRFGTNFDESLNDVIIQMDAEQFQLALINIFENAIDACLEDKSKQEHRIEFKVHSKDGKILFTIEDNGVGMDEATKEKIFTLFFSSKANKGTGIGLFVTNKIIKQHHAEIIVDTQINKGTRFTLELPVRQPA